MSESNKRPFRRLLLVIFIILAAQAPLLVIGLLLVKAGYSDAPVFLIFFVYEVVVGQGCLTYYRRYLTV